MNINRSQINNFLHLVGWVTTLYMIFLWSPIDTSVGLTQKIFYFHVPVGWLGMLAIFGVGIASIMFLITKDYKWDDLAFSFAQVGIIFASLIIITGALWAKPVWGVWWTWDPKLTTTVVLWFIFSAYLLLRNLITDKRRSALIGSIIAVLGSIDAPLIYFASILWRTAHPELNIGPLAEDDSSLPGTMLLTFFISLIMHTYLFIILIRVRRNITKQERLFYEQSV
jgi:heme exporter protein C